MFVASRPSCFLLRFACVFFACIFLSSLSWDSGGVSFAASFILPVAPTLSAAEVYAPVSAAPVALPCRAGLLCARRLGNGDTIYYGYDPHSAGGLRGEPTTMLLAGADGAFLAVQTYVYDAAGEISERKTVYADGSGEAWDYVYDGERRLAVATRTVLLSGARERWVSAYDGNGNATAELFSGRLSLMSYDGLDRRTDLSHGLRGGVFPGGHGVRYVYDDRGLPAGWAASGGRRAVLSFFPNGLRAGKRSSRGGLRYYYAGAKLSDVVSASGSISHYAYADGLLGYAVAGGLVESARYYFSDHAGSVTAVLDGSGKVSDKQSYGPYGAQSGGSTDGFALNANAIGFHGRYEDAGTGNLMYASRLYGGAGRFTTQDTEHTPNLYRAYNDDPVGHGDDGGHMAYSLLANIVPPLAGNIPQDEAEEEAQASNHDGEGPGIKTINGDQNSATDRPWYVTAIAFGISALSSMLGAYKMGRMDHAYTNSERLISGDSDNTNKVSTRYQSMISPDLTDELKRKAIMTKEKWSTLFQFAFLSQMVGAAFLADDAHSMAGIIATGVTAMALSGVMAFAFYQQRFLSKSALYALNLNWLLLAPLAGAAEMAMAQQDVDWLWLSMLFVFYGGSYFAGQCKLSQSGVSSNRRLLNPAPSFAEENEDAQKIIQKLIDTGMIDK